MIELRPATQVDAQPAPTKLRSGSTKNSIRFDRLLAPLKALSFRNRARIIALVSAVLPGLAVGALSYTILDRTVTNQVLQQEQATAKTASQTVRQYMMQRHAEIQALANLPTLNDQQLYNALSQADKTAVLSRIAQSYSVYSNIAVIAPDGSVLLQTGEQKIPNQANQAYFQAALKADSSSRHAVAAFEPSAAALYISAPIKEIASGKTIAVVRTTLPTSQLAELLQQSTGRDFRLTDASGRVVAASDSCRICEAPMPTASDATTGLSPWTNPKTQQQHLLTQATVAEIAQLSDLNWRVTLSLPTDQALQSQQVQLLLLVTAGVAIVTALLATLLTDRLTRQLVSIRNTIQSTPSNSLPRLSIAGQDEVAVLGQTINQITEQVEAVRQEQKQAVYQFQQLNEVAFNIRKSTHFDTIVQTGVREVRRLFKVDRAIVYLFDQDWYGTIIAESVAFDIPAAFGAKVADPCFAEKYIEKYRAGRVHAIADVDAANLDPCYRGQLKQFQVKANLVAPMVVEGQLIGLLVVHQCQAPRDWQAAEKNLLVQIAVHLGYAIEQATLATQVALAQARHQQKEALSKQLAELLQQAEKAVRGDLTVRTAVNGEEVGMVSDFFNVIVENLERIVHQVKQSALQVNGSLDEHEVAVRSLSQDALRQAEETALTIGYISQLIQSIQSVADHAQQAAQVSQTAALTAEGGRLAVHDTVQDILNLRQTMSETAKKVKRLGESAQQISKAVSLINQIEKQTNVLAINAGIEAARTIENQGFAAIAEEVGALAARASKATHEISHLVDTIQQETIEVVQAMEHSTAQVVTGTQSAEHAKQSLEQIMQVSAEIDQLVRSISDATVSQVRTSGTMTDLMQTIAEVAKQTSSSSLQVSRSLRQTMDVAKSLQDSVQTFKVGSC